MEQNSDRHELAARLRKHVVELAGKIGPRHDGRPESLAAAVAMVTREWEQMGQAVEVQVYPSDGEEASNLVVEWPGVTKPDEIVVVGAHYDTVWTTPGADDNASAVAGLLETTRALAGRRFARTLRFVAFANEEPPHFQGPTMGSAVYAHRCRAAGDDVYLMVCLEMLGYFDDAPGSQRPPPGLPAAVAAMLPDRANFIAVVSDVASAPRLAEFAKAFVPASGVPTVAQAVPNADRLLWLSDHGPFWDHGYPALMVTDTSLFRNPHYHEASDLPDTLDYDAMAGVVSGVIAGVAALAGMLGSQSGVSDRDP